MIITYHGAAMIKIQQGDLVVTLNPDDSNQLRIGGKNPFVIDGPGEYEVAGTFIRGFASTGSAGKINTIYNVTVDGKRLVHLGALADPELPPTVKEELAPVDILFVPIGQPRLTASAYQLALSFNPHLIVPVLYTPSTLTNFLKEAGEEKVETQDKLSLKGRELLEREGEVVVLKVV